MPLPCSPVSHSAPSSETHSSVPPSGEDSDDSLTTPRPGPADPSQRTHENLSRPSLPPPVISTSPESLRGLREARSAKGSRKGSPDSAGGKKARGDEPNRFSSSRPVSPASQAATKTDKRDTPFDTQTEGHPYKPFGRGSSPRKPAPAAGWDRIQYPERNSSVSFTAQTSKARPERQGSYSSPAMSRRTPNASPHTVARRIYDDYESSADESTAIVSRVAGRGYGTASVGPGQVTDDVGGAGYEGAAEEDQPRRRRPGNKSRSGSADNANRRDEDTRQDVDQEKWWKRMVDKYGSLELENKGSVARDHLALERTFLAWLRTSLAFASIGVAVTQLFRLNSSLRTDEHTDTSQISTFELLMSNAEPSQKLRHVGKPLGATFLGISILILLLGFHRYFESQHYVIRGKFPASRGSIVLVSLVTFALIVTSLVVVLTIAPSALERK